MIQHACDHDLEGALDHIGALYNDYTYLGELFKHP